MKIGVIQINSIDHKNTNMKKIIKYIEEAKAEGADLVSMPEYVNYLSEDEHKVAYAEEIEGETISMLAAKAREHRMYIHCGSILEEGDGEKAYNTSVLINPQGNVIAKYRKLHLFDIEIEGRVSAKESSAIIPGDHVVCANTSFGKVGLTICYDLRFPELYRQLALRGASIIFVPAAITMYTGMNHWEVLLRARAIENQCFIIAPGQIGSHAPNRIHYGNSMVIDPFGTVISRSPEKEGVTVTNIDLKHIEEVRKNIPCFSQRRTDIYSIR